MKLLPDPNLNWPIPLAAVELIANAEGLCLKAYRCPAGKPTIGWGQTEDVGMGMVWTKQQADEDLCRSITARCEQVLAACTREPTAFELGAMVSLQYNIGQAAFARSRVLRAHNAADVQSASRAFGLWNKANVNGVAQELRGLTARRAAEAALYLRPIDGSPPLRMPQAVEPQSSMAASPIVQSGAAAVVAGSVSVAATVKEHIGLVGDITAGARAVVVDSLGIPAGALAPLLLLVVGGVVIWQRYKQRIKGWA